MLAYFGGKFPFSYKDFTMKNLSKDYRAKLIGVSSLVRTKFELPTTKKGLVYMGPFYFYDDETSAEEIVRRESDIVESVDVCYFLLDKDAAMPGTVTEIINAALHKKIIKIFYVKEEIDIGEPEREVASPLWYPILFAQTHNAENTTVIGFDTLEEAEDALITDAT